MPKTTYQRFVAQTGSSYPIKTQINHVTAMISLRIMYPQLGAINCNFAIGFNGFQQIISVFQFEIRKIGYLDILSLVCTLHFDKSQQN